MDPLIALVVGLIIGWLIEWVIDWTYWRRGHQRLLKQLASADSEITALRSSLKSASASRDDIAPPAPNTPRGKDPLEVIKGIGPIFARRLNHGGIFTFEELARLTPAEVRRVVAVADWHKIEPEEWIAEAAQWAQARGIKA